MMKNLPVSKPILISLSPNTEKDDILLALSLILRPWMWKSFSVVQRNVQRSSAVSNTEELERKFERYLEVKHAFAFNSGRAAFLAILNSLNLEQGSEILLQAFTCNATVNPITQADLKPVFVDIDEKTLNIDTNDLEKKISNKSRVVVIQHTFGLSADMEKIMDICQRHNLILIEDCAHSLGATHNGKKVGVLGKAAFFSFGRDKIISSVFGGLAATNDDDLAEKLKRVQKNLEYPCHCWIFQQLLHPILTNFLVIPLYNFGDFGKWTLIFLQKIGLLSKAVSRQEKQGIMPDNFAKKMPQAMVILALNQFQKLEKIIAHQREIADFYDKNLAGLVGLTLPPQNPERVYLRYPVLIKTRDTGKILEEARKTNIFLDDGWRKTAIVPPDTDQNKMGYRAGDCPIAEKVAENIINLPTHINISEQKAEKIVNFLKTEFTEARPL